MFLGVSLCSHYLSTSQGLALTHPVSLQYLVYFLILDYSTEIRLRLSNPNMRRTQLNS